MQRSRLAATPIAPSKQNHHIQSMKYLSLLFLILVAHSAKSQAGNNVIGIGVGRAALHAATTPAGKTKIGIHTFFYDNSSFPYTTISHITSPTLYFSKRVYKHWHFRANASYQYRTYFTDKTGWMTEPDPSWNPDRYSYNNISYLKTLSTAIGVQYNIQLGKFRIYPAVEYFTTVDWLTYKDFYAYSSQPNSGFVDVSKTRYVDVGLNVLAGVEYSCNRHFSLAYELGLMQNEFGLMARLSANYRF